MSSDLLGICFIITTWNQEESMCLTVSTTCVLLFKPLFPVAETPALPLFAQKWSKASQDIYAQKSDRGYSAVLESTGLIFHSQRKPIWTFLNSKFGNSHSYPYAHPQSLRESWTVWLRTPVSLCTYKEFYAQVFTFWSSTPGISNPWAIGQYQFVVC